MLWCVVPVLAQLPAAAVGREKEGHRPGERHRLAAVGQAYPPLHRRVIAIGDRCAPLQGDVGLGRGDLSPVAVYALGALKSVLEGLFAVL